MGLLTVGFLFTETGKQISAWLMGMDPGLQGDPEVPDPGQSEVLGLHGGADFQELTPFSEQPVQQSDAGFADRPDADQGQGQTGIATRMLGLMGADKFHQPTGGTQFKKVESVITQYQQSRNTAFTFARA